jgi:hypothetical protein
MWWATGAFAKEPVGHPRPLVRRRLRLIEGLEKVQANADGDPAADGFENFQKQLVAARRRAQGVKTGRRI